MSAQLNYPTTTLPLAAETAIFRAFDGVLRADPVLNNYVHTWASWKGEDVDMLDLQGIPAAMCPFLRLSPWPIASNRETEIQHRMPMQVRMELVVVGTDIDALMNFAGAVRFAIFPQNNPTLRDAITKALHDAGATRGEITLSGYGAFRDPDQIPILIGEGTIKFNALVNT